MLASSSRWERASLFAEGCHLKRKTDDLVRAAKTREIFDPINQRRSLKGYVLVRLKDGDNKSWGGFSPVRRFSHAPQGIKFWRIASHAAWVRL